MEDNKSFYYECKRCLYQTINKVDMKRHLDKKLKCEFTNQSNYNFVSDELWKTDSLIKKFTKEPLKKNNKFDLEKIVCENCGKEFTRKYTLDRHFNSCFSEKERDEFMKQKLFTENEFRTNNNITINNINNYNTINTVRTIQINNTIHIDLKSLIEEKKKRDLEKEENKNNNLERWEYIDYISKRSINSNYLVTSQNDNTKLVMNQSFDSDYVDSHISFETKIRLFTSIDYLQLLYELLKNPVNINVSINNNSEELNENNKIIVYYQVGFKEVSKEELERETILKLKKYYLNNYLDLKKIHQSIDEDVLMNIMDPIYRSILRKSDLSYIEEVYRIYKKRSYLINIENIKNTLNLSFIDESESQQQFIFF